jgi:hypothetical protein
MPQDAIESLIDETAERLCAGLNPWGEGDMGKADVEKLLREFREAVLSQEKHSAPHN